MVETDWKEILSISQSELTLDNKEKLCESLCSMEADDIELNFSDLKTLFRLAQDILKLKSEQVKNLLGQLKSTHRKGSKTKIESPYAVSPTQSNDSALETITHQEEIIRANKEILEQLYADIADLESRKGKLEENRSNLEVSSDSSRDVLSELNAVAELENEVSMKNKHIRKLLSDVKILEDENTKLKDKVSILRDKLTEATALINNFSGQILTVNNECSQLKEILAKTEEKKAQLLVEIEELKNEVIAKDSSRETIFEETKSKLVYWKNVAKSKKAEVESLSREILKLKEAIQSSKVQPPAISSPKENIAEQLKIKELQDKLIEASAEIENSAEIIEILRAENSQLKAVVDDVPNCLTSEITNESDEGKERIINQKLKKKVVKLTTSLKDAEELITAKEKELAELTSQLQLLRSDEGLNALLEGLKNKKRQLKSKDECIKSLVYETNNMNQLIDELQLENETFRLKYNIPSQEKIPTKGIIKDYHNLKDTNVEMSKKIKKQENKLVELELSNHNLKSQISNLLKILNEQGYMEEIIEEISGLNHDVIIKHDKGNSVSEKEKEAPSKPNIAKEEKEQNEILFLIEENKGLRQGLQEILDFLKDNSKTSSGILTLECPSLEKILLSMEARNSAGWYAPHMSTIMELRAALGGKDALLIALQDARKETFKVMTQLSDATKKSTELELKLNEIQQINKQKEADEQQLQFNSADSLEFGSWISEKEQINIDFYDTSQIENLVQKRNSFYGHQLKKGLEYFHKKFKDLFDKLTCMAIQASDNCNKWSLQEELYKAEIENLKSQLQQEVEDVSECSPGSISVINTHSLQRKCLYLEESYRHIRTLNENIKSEILEIKRGELLTTSQYELQIQRLMISVASLTEKLCCSIPFELFWKQNVDLNEVNTKYRKVIENIVTKENSLQNILNILEDDKRDILNQIQRNFSLSGQSPTNTHTNETKIEQIIENKQIRLLTSEIENKTKEVNKLEEIVAELQQLQGKLIDNNLTSTTEDEVILMKEKLEKLINDNKILKEQYQHVTNQLNITLIELQDAQQKQLCNDMEINMLQHQVLDLQSTSDSKAIIARLSGEIIIAHLQTSEYYKKIERLTIAFNIEKQAREEVEEIMKTQQKIFDVYTLRFESRFRYIYEMMQIFRQQYQGYIPRASIENYVNTIEEFYRKHHAVDAKLLEIEDLRTNLIIKHSVFDQILDVSKGKCLVDEDMCPHKLKLLMTQSINSREREHLNKKLASLEESRENLIKHCNYLERTLVLVNQGFKSGTNQNTKHNENRTIKEKNDDNNYNIQSETDSSSSHRSKTITLTRPEILEQKKTVYNMPDISIKNESQSSNRSFTDIGIQTTPKKIQKLDKLIQTDKIENQIEILQTNFDKKSKELSEAMIIIQKRSEEVLNLNKDKISLEATIQNLKEINNEKETLNTRLRLTIEELKKHADDLKITHITESNKIKNSINEENKSLLVTLNQLEKDKNTIYAEFKELLNNEREEYTKSVNELHSQITELQSKLDRRGSESSVSNGESLKEVTAKYTMKITELENKCFKLQNELDDSKAELSTYQSEADRWKDLATERLTKLEQLNLQLEERHSHEVKSYKAESQHWLSQLNDMQREHMDLRTRLTDQKTAYIKQLSEKDTQIEQLRTVINNLKTQVMNMQTLITVNDPNFDLSAIVEVEETSDILSQNGSDRLELKFDSSVDLHESQENIMRIPASSTAIWQEPVIERLRREKQLVGKQNAILRRQIKVLAARERRARLDAQNLKNQIFRISTTGNKVTTAETAALHNKISSLQAQLTSARRDTHSSIALWDKWKRSQQAADRWQARCEEKCQEVMRLEASLQLTKSAVTRLEKEKRVLLSRLNEAKSENQLSVVEKQEAESPEKSHRSSKECVFNTSPLPVSSQALLDRVQAQQRKIAALEVAEKGKELLVSEYERALAEITSLKGQVLKLESTLLESQIRTPFKSTTDSQPELEYWKSYCEMLKEENIQLTQKINSLETMPTTSNQHRINDLEQTVLTLRGVINKLQSEHKSGYAYKRVDSRPNSSRSGTEKGRTQLESYRIEIINLKRAIHDKDLLLEKSKEMLKIAAEREEDLLRKNAYLTQQLEEITRPKEGFLSA